MGTQLHQLNEFGQSIWLDNIRRNMFASGDLHRLIADGLRGMTSNPTIFEKAIGAGNDYDEQLQSLVGTEHEPVKLFWALAVRDIQSACDEFRQLYDSTNGGDGFVSLEVSPLLAHDTAGTIAAAKELWALVDRPNLMVKIPGTPEGPPAIRAVIGSGINVNVTLLFSVEQYEAAANAFLGGLEDRAGRGEPIDRIASVASVFVSRIDVAVDKALDAKIAAGAAELTNLLGKTATANTKLIYQKYLELFESERFEKLKAKGGRVQRPLWASTSTKNPHYPDLMYVGPLVGKNTVNTVPPNTLEAIVDHGTFKADAVLEDLDAARADLAAVEKAGISLEKVNNDLQVEGVSSFSDSFNAMLAAITYKAKALEGSVR